MSTSKLNLPLREVSASAITALGYGGVNLTNDAVVTYSQTVDSAADSYSFFASDSSGVGATEVTALQQVFPRGGATSGSQPYTCYDHYLRTGGQLGSGPSATLQLKADKLGCIVVPETQSTGLSPSYPNPSGDASISIINFPASLSNYAQYTTYVAATNNLAGSVAVTNKATVGYFQDPTATPPGPYGQDIQSFDVCIPHAVAMSGLTRLNLGIPLDSTRQGAITSAGVALVVSCPTITASSVVRLALVGTSSGLAPGSFIVPPITVQPGTNSTNGTFTVGFAGPSSGNIYTYIVYG